jgi:hypothetical protein
MLSSFGIRAYRNLHRKFFSAGFSNSIFIMHNGLGPRHLLAGFGSGRDARPDNVWRCWLEDKLLISIHTKFDSAWIKILKLI